MALLLIGIGAIWLLGQLNVLSGASFAILGRIWPVILIAIGINILVARNDSRLSLLIGIATIVMILALMVLGPALGWVDTPVVQHQVLNEPLAGAQRADIRLDLSVGDATVRSTDDSTDLFRADVNYVGDLRFDVSGDETRVVRLRNESQSSDAFNFQFLNWGNAPERLNWDIELTPSIPLSLDVNGGVGDSRLDLNGLNLTSLNINTGVGEVSVVLPQGEYPASIRGGVGSTDIRFSEGAVVTLTVHAGVGSTSITLPANTPVRLDASSGLGGVSVPADLVRISGEQNAGVWQTDSFSTADPSERITIQYSGGVGSLTIR
jgi:predicted membrane protein